MPREDIHTEQNATQSQSQPQKKIYPKSKTTPNRGGSYPIPKPFPKTPGFAKQEQKQQPKKGRS
jgi:hypothetical protein